MQQFGVRWAVLMHRRLMQARSGLADSINCFFILILSSRL